MDQSISAINIEQITLIQALLVGLVVISISITIAIIHAFSTQAKALNRTTLLGIHITAWQASAGMNILFWIGISATPLYAVLLGMISLVMDIAKISIPRLKNQKIIHRLAMWFFILISIFATQNIGSQISQQSDLNDQVAAAKLKRINAEEDAAKTRVKEGYVSPKIREDLRKDQQQLRTLQRESAVNSKGDYVYSKGKKQDVFTMTNGCDPDNAFTKIRQNHCKTIQNLQKSISDTSDTLSDTSDNKAKLSETLKNAEKELKAEKADLPINEFITKLLLMVGMDSEKAHDLGTISFIFGLIVAVCLDLVINGTIPSPPKPKRTGWTHTMRIYFRLLKAAKNAQKSGDTSGTVRGYFSDTSVGKCREPKKDKFLQKTDPLDELRKVTLDNVETHINFKIHHLTFHVKLGHKDAVVFLLTRKNESGKSLLGEDASINQIYQETRNQFGAGGGIKKDHINEAKQILYFNGIMVATPYGAMGKITYKYHTDLDLIAIKYNAVKRGLKIKPFIPEIKPEVIAKTTLKDSASAPKNTLKKAPKNTDQNVVELDLFRNHNGGLTA
jgi:hypothetical protein